MSFSPFLKSINITTSSFFQVNLQFRKWSWILKKNLQTYWSQNWVSDYQLHHSCDSMFLGFKIYCMTGPWSRSCLISILNSSWKQKFELLTFEFECFQCQCQPREWAPSPYSIYEAREREFPWTTFQILSLLNYIKIDFRGHKQPVYTKIMLITGLFRYFWEVIFVCIGGCSLRSYLWSLDIVNTSVIVRTVQMTHVPTLS